MATKRPQLVKGISPKGTFRYPHLVTPDNGTEEYPKKNPEYNVQLIMSKEEGAAFREKLQDSIDAAEELAHEKDAKRKPASRKKNPMEFNDPMQPEYDDETEEETGNVIFRFKTQASGKTKAGKKWSKQIAFRDAKTKKFSPDAVWGGTVGRIAYSINPYFVEGNGMWGITLFIDAVQIIDLVANSGDSGDCGFEEEEGFESSSEEQFEEADESYDDDDDDDDNEDEDGDF